MKLKFEKIGSRPSKLVSLHVFHSLINHISHIEMSLIAENLNIDQNKFRAILIHPAIPQGVEAESFWKPKAKSFPTLLSCPLIITSKAETGWVVPSLGTQRVENCLKHSRWSSWSFPNLYSSSVIYSFIKTWIHQIFLKHESLGPRNNFTSSHTIGHNPLQSLDRSPLIHRVPIFNCVLLFLLLFVRIVLLFTDTYPTGNGFGRGLKAGRSCGADTGALVLLPKVEVPPLVNQLHHRLVKIGDFFLVKGGCVDLGRGGGGGPRRRGEIFVNWAFQLQVFHLLSFLPPQMLLESAIQPEYKRARESRIITL